MNHTPFGDTPFEDDDAFASVAFEGGTAADDDDYTDDNDHEYAADANGLTMMMMDDNDDDTEEPRDRSAPSHGPDDISSVYADLDDEPRDVPAAAAVSSPRDGISGVYVQQQGRSDYAARRCKNVDMMTQRLMIHNDDYYKSDYRPGFCSNRVFWCGFLVLGVLAIAGGILVLEVPFSQPARPLEPNETPLVAESPPSETKAPTLADGMFENMFQNAGKVEVPFASHHNLEFDGVLFVKTPGDSSSPTEEDGNGSSGYTDSFAKTLDPITELHFAPGESDKTKHIVLTTSPPDFAADNRLENSEYFSERSDSDPGLVLTIGLEASGEVWLPKSTGQNIHEGIGSGNHHHLRQQQPGITRGIYGAGDRFALKISGDTISLFRNDYHELVGMWANPTTVSPSSASSLYAQIWFREPQSSMAASAWYDERRR